jgi:hypothetical protein
MAMLHCFPILKTAYAIKIHEKTTNTARCIIPLVLGRKLVSINKTKHQSNQAVTSARQQVESESAAKFLLAIAKEKLLVLALTLMLVHAMHPPQILPLNNMQRLCERGNQQSAIGGQMDLHPM